MTHPTTTLGIMMPEPNIQAQSVTMRKRIGSTTYTVNVHFSSTSRETMNDKILRLVQNDAANGKAVRQ